MSEHSRTSRAFWATAPGRGELREQALAEPAAGEVLVRTRYSGVSRGSESLVFSGRVPESEFARMRAPFQQCEFPFPVCYGYSSVGEVESGPASLIGRPVFCLHPHQDRYVLPASAVVPLPTGVPMARAVLAANLETALNAVWDGAAGPGDTIAVVGGGVVGLLTGALAAAIPGCSVTLIDINVHRRAPAEALGMTFAEPDDAPEDCDLVFHASGRDEGLDAALRRAGSLHHRDELVRRCARKPAVGPGLSCPPPHVALQPGRSCAAATPAPLDPPATTRDGAFTACRRALRHPCQRRKRLRTNARYHAPTGRRRHRRPVPSDSLPTPLKIQGQPRGTRPCIR